MWIASQNRSKLVNTNVCKEITASENHILVDGNLIGSYESRQETGKLLADIMMNLAMKEPYYLMPFKAADIENTPNTEGDVNE